MKTRSMLYVMIVVVVACSSPDRQLKTDDDGGAGAGGTAGSGASGGGSSGDGGVGGSSGDAGVGGASGAGTGGVATGGTGSGATGGSSGVGGAGATSGSGGASGSGGGGGSGGTGGSSGTGGTGGTGGCGDDGTGWNTAWQTLECQLIQLVNQRRTQGTTCGGVAYVPALALTRNQALTNAARSHAQDMGDNNYYAPIGLDGRNEIERMQQAGFSGTTFFEVRTAGPQASTTQAVLNDWLGNATACSFMDPRLRYVGVGYYYAPLSSRIHYWVADFGG